MESESGADAATSGPTGWAPPEGFEEITQEELIRHIDELATTKDITTKQKFDLVLGQMMSFANFNNLIVVHYVENKDVVELYTTISSHLLRDIDGNLVEISTCQWMITEDSLVSVGAKREQKGDPTSNRSENVKMLKIEWIGAIVPGLNSGLFLELLINVIAGSSNILYSLKDDCSELALLLKRERGLESHYVHAQIQNDPLPSSLGSDYDSYNDSYNDTQVTDFSNRSDSQDTDSDNEYFVEPPQLMFPKELDDDSLDHLKQLIRTEVEHVIPGTITTIAKLDEIKDSEEKIKYIEEKINEIADELIITIFTSLRKTESLINVTDELLDRLVSEIVNEILPEFLHSVKLDRSILTNTFKAFDPASFTYLNELIDGLLTLMSGGRTKIEMLLNKMQDRYDKLYGVVVKEAQITGSTRDSNIKKNPVLKRPYELRSGDETKSGGSKTRARKPHKTYKNKQNKTKKNKKTNKNKKKNKKLNYSAKRK